VLSKQLGLLDIFSMAAGAMISSGLFVLPGIAFGMAGPSVVISYLIAGLLMIPSILAKAELGTAMPKSGGTYFFVERSLGPLAGTFAGFANWLSISLKSAFALVGIGSLGALLFPDHGEWTIKLIAIGGCAFFGVLNALSVKSSGRMQSFLVVGLLVIITTYIALSLPSVKATRFEPFSPEGWQATFAVAGMVFVSYGGLTKVASVAEEVRNPGRNIPLGMFLAFGVVNTLYVLAVFATVGVLEPGELAASLTPIADAASHTMGSAASVVYVAAFLAFVTTANAGMLSAARSPMAMSRDGLIAEFFSRTNKRFGTPHVSIAFTSLFMMLAVAFLSIDDLVKVASTIMIIMFMLVNAAVIIMRQSGLQNYRPTFRAPLYPWLPAAGFVAYGFILFEMGTVPLLLTGAFTLLTGAWYVLYVRPRIERESAFEFLVRRIVSKEIGGRPLENELRAIALERDEVEADRFDDLVKHAKILDIEEELPARELFSRAAEALAPRLGVEAQFLEEKFLSRERESSTVIEPGLAIPHVIVPGENIFELLLVRCKEGAVFSELHPPVTTAFFLVGSADQRNFHLKALMIVAHIVQEPGFYDRWQSAASTEALRDVLLLSKRTRQKHPL
jgi:amino acid transporter/mannitol/fructose-specific phosphotransferase system IIA component (Ntr-type)